MQYLKLVMMYSCCNIDLHSPRIGVHLFLRKLPLLTCAVMILSFLPITSIPDFPASLSASPSFLDFFLVILYSILCPKSHSFSYLHLLSNLHLIIFLFSFRVCASFVILGQFSFHLCLNSHIPSFFQFFPNLHGICALFCFFSSSIDLYGDVSDLPSFDMFIFCFVFFRRFFFRAFNSIWWPIIYCVYLLIFGCLRSGFCSPYGLYIFFPLYFLLFVWVNSADIPSLEVLIFCFAFSTSSFSRLSMTNLRSSTLVYILI